ncbi:MAG: response regulator [Chlamydiae bacterium]|nr:response regulator [Chlamydiota bacterium]
MIDCALIIDDDEETHLMTAHLLRQSGLIKTIASAASGEEALNLMQEGLKASIILLDIHMPMMSGWQFIEECEKLKLDMPKIAILTVSVEEKDRLKAKKYNYPFLQKPLTKSLLENMLHDIRKC